ncbi:inositol 2-dehydrogenase [bacterium SCN 62-11]|nr:inositol 2-dehydrogenase [Candidatus Eremiobacteraeota bacterium]ODT64609.1 MAG: inositol 2-dehydrogenase [bacterium SCN 62-11]
MVRLGLVGTGRIGQLHVETLLKSQIGELVGVTDLNLDAARACAERYGVPKVAHDVQDLLHNYDIQGLLICSSTNTHANYCLAAANAGKHIFCEKPIDADLARIDAVIHEVERTGVKMMVGFNRRFDPNHRRIKQSIEQGKIGTPHLLHIISRDPAPPPLEYIKVSGGMFFDMTIHDFDMARFLLGEVDEVYASAAVRVDPRIGEVGDVDTALITLKFLDGSLGTIDNSRQAVYGYDQRVEVFGSAGVLRSENVFPDEVTLSTAHSVERGLPKNFFMDRYLASYQAELETFVRCIAEDRGTPVTAHDGRAPVVMALAAQKSLAENRPVKLSEIQP